MIELEFKFIDFIPCSTNDMYIPSSTRTKRGRPHHFFRKSDQLIKWQKSIKESFDKEFFYTKEYLYSVSSYINNMKRGFNLELKVSIPYEYYYKLDNDVTKKDTSNFIKAIEDSIMSGIGVDDKRNITINSEKGYNEDGVWYIYAKLVESSIHNRIDVDINKAYINKKGD